MSKIGHIRANNTTDPDSRDSIMCGYVTGDGLLGEVVKATCKLIDAVKDFEYSGNDSVQACNRLKQARLNLYDALKAIEEASSGKS